MTNGRRARGVGVLSAVSSGDTARRFQDWAIAQAFYGEALRKARGRREKSTVYARIASLFLDSSSDPDLIAALEKRQHLLPRLERKSNRFASFSASQRRKAGETSKAKGEPHPEIWDGGGSRASAVATLNNEGEERGAHDDVARTHSRSGDKTVFSKSTGGHRDSDITLQEPLSFSFNRWRGPPVSPSSVEFSSSHSSSAFCSSSSSPRNATGNPLFASSSLRAKQKASSLPRHGSSQVHSSPPLEEERQEQKDCFIDNFSSLACRRGQDGFSNLQGGPNPSTTKGDTFLMFKAREYAVKSLRCNPSNFVGLYVSAMAEGLSCRWCSASVVALSSLNLLSRGRLFKRHSRELLFRYYPWTSPRNRLCSVSPSSSSFTGERCRQNLSSSFSSFLSSSDGSFSSPNGAQLSPLTSSSFSRLLPLSFRRGFLPSHVFVSSSLFAALSRAVHLKQKRKWRFLYSLPSAYNHTSLQRDSGKGENALGPSCTSERTTAADDFTCLRGVDEFQGGEGIQDQTSFFYHSSDRSPLRFPTMRKFCLSNSSSAGRLCSLFNSRNGSMIRHVYGDLKLLHMRSSLMAGYPMECLYSLCDFLYVMETTQWKRPETTDTSGLFTPCLLKLRSHTTEGKPSENVSLSAAACEGKEPTERGEETLLNSSWSNWILQAIFLGVQAVCEVQRVVVSKAHQCEREENRKLSSAAGGPFFTLDWKLLDEIEAQITKNRMRRKKQVIAEDFDSLEDADSSFSNIGPKRHSDVFSPSSFARQSSETPRTIANYSLPSYSDSTSTSSPSFCALTGKSVESYAGVAMVVEAAATLFLSERKNRVANKRTKSISDFQAHDFKSREAWKVKFLEMLSCWSCDTCTTLFDHANENADYGLMALAAAWRARCLLHARRWEEAIAESTQALALDMWVPAELLTSRGHSPSMLAGSTSSCDAEDPRTTRLSHCNKKAKAGDEGIYELPLLTLYSPLHVRSIARLQAGRTTAAASDSVLRYRLTHLTGKTVEGPFSDRPGTHTEHGCQMSAPIKARDHEKATDQTTATDTLLSYSNSSGSEEQHRFAAVKEVNEGSFSQPEFSRTVRQGPLLTASTLSSKTKHHEKDREHPVSGVTLGTAAKKSLRSPYQTGHTAITGENGICITLQAGGGIPGSEAKVSGSDSYPHFENEGPLTQSGKQVSKCACPSAVSAPLPPEEPENLLTRQIDRKLSKEEVSGKTGRSLVNSREPTVRWGRTLEEVTRLNLKRENRSRILFGFTSRP